MQITAGASAPAPLLGQIPLTFARYSFRYPSPQFVPDTPPSVRQGGSVELKFSLQYDNGLPFTCFWSKNGVPIPGATNATLRIDNAQRSDAGYYTVFMTDGTQASQIGTALAVEDSVTLDLTADGKLQLRGNPGSFTPFKLQPTSKTGLRSKPSPPNPPRRQSPPPLPPQATSFIEPSSSRTIPNRR